MRKASSVISLLIGLLIISIIAIGIFRSYYGVNLNDNTAPKALKQQVDEKVQEIETLKNQSLEFQKSIRID